MNIPEYTKDAVYQELANICEMAGVSIKYAEMDGPDAAKTNKYDLIKMADTDIEEFDAPGVPTLILGHELGHCLGEKPSPNFVETFEKLMTAAKQYETVGDFIYASDELIADLAGEFLFSLAEMIGCHRADQEPERILASLPKLHNTP